MTFPVYVAADWNSKKVNVVLSFDPRRDTINSLLYAAESAIPAGAPLSSSWNRRGAPRRDRGGDDPFSTRLCPSYAVIYNDVLCQWDTLIHRQQLSPHCQIYIFQDGIPEYAAPIPDAIDLSAPPLEQHLSYHRGGGAISAFTSSILTPSSAAANGTPLGSSPQALRFQYSPLKPDILQHHLTAADPGYSATPVPLQPSYYKRWTVPPLSSYTFHHRHRDSEQSHHERTALSRRHQQPMPWATSTSPPCSTVSTASRAASLEPISDEMLHLQRFTQATQTATGAVAFSESLPLPRSVSTPVERLKKETVETQMKGKGVEEAMAPSTTFRRQRTSSTAAALNYRSVPVPASAPSLLSSHSVTMTTWRPPLHQSRRSSSALVHQRWPHDGSLLSTAASDENHHGISLSPSTSLLTFGDHILQEERERVEARMHMSFDVLRQSLKAEERHFALLMESLA